MNNLTRHESYAASALQGLIAARTNFDIREEVETAWRYADGMEAEAARRAKLAMADQLPRDCKVTIQAKADYRYALAEGIKAAAEAGIEYSNRDRRLIGEVLDAYGRASGAVEKPFFGRCELSHIFAEVCCFTFQPKQAEPS